MAVCHTTKYLGALNLLSVHSYETDLLTNRLYVIIVYYASVIDEIEYFRQRKSQKKFF